MSEVSKNKKILVVDDEEAIRFLIKRYLESAGYSVVEAANGKEALGIVNNTFNAQLVDINMPIMDGLQYLKELEKTPIKIPTLIVTGHLDDVEYPVLRKPFQKQNLLETLNKIVN